jgi:hypothetical protein
VIEAQPAAGAPAGDAYAELLADDDTARAFVRLLREGQSVLVATIDAEGRVLFASPALTRLLEREVVGLAIDALVAPGCRDALVAARGPAGSDGFITLQFLALNGPFSAAVLVEPRRGGHVLVGEVPLDDQLALAAALQALNADLAVLTRESARRTQELERAHRELRDAHWHITKIAEVLPMCIECKRVRTGPDAWETVASYLTRSSDFLSHGYCAGCAARLIDPDSPEDA